MKKELETFRQSQDTKPHQPSPSGANWWSKLVPPLKVYPSAHTFCPSVSPTQKITEIKNSQLRKREQLLMDPRLSDARAPVISKLAAFLFFFFVHFLSDFFTPYCSSYKINQFSICIFKTS